MDAVMRSDQCALGGTATTGHRRSGAGRLAGDLGSLCPWRVGLDDQPPATAPITHRTRWAVTAAAIRYWGAGDVTAAEQVLAEVGGPVTGAHRAGPVSLDGRVEPTLATEENVAVAAGWSMLRGLVAKARGDLATAVAALDTAVQLLEKHDTDRMLTPCLAELAAAQAMTGERTQAQHTLRRAAEGPADQLFTPLFGLSQAWTTAADGDTTLAARQADTAADLAMAAGQFAVEAAARYDVARLGDPHAAHRRLATLAGVVQNPLTRAMAGAAAALARSDVHGLDRATATFTKLGFDLLAAETTTASAANRNQTTAALRPDAATPLLRLTPALARLTTRERDVTLLVADGMTSTAIGNRLRLSARTVDNYLGRIYQKLGVTNRRDVVPLVLREKLEMNVR